MRMHMHACLQASSFLTVKESRGFFYSGLILTVCKRDRKVLLNMYNVQYFAFLNRRCNLTFAIQFIFYAKYRHTVIRETGIT